MTGRTIKPATKRRSLHLYRLALLAAATWILNSAALPARGQDLDLVLYAGDPAKPAMIDKIEDAEEREAFVALKAVQDPGRKRELAEEFLRKYPESWLTSFRARDGGQGVRGLGRPAGWTGPRQAVIRNPA